MSLFCLSQYPYKHLTKAIVVQQLLTLSGEILGQLGFEAAPCCLYLHGSKSQPAFLSLEGWQEYNEPLDYLAYFLTYPFLTNYH